MTDERTKSKNNLKEEIVSSLVPSINYTFIQCLMLFTHYGLNYEMPWWVTWFPSLVYGGFTAIILLLLLILGIISLIFNI
jgi:hypothetical protein